MVKKKVRDEDEADHLSIFSKIKQMSTVDCVIIYVIIVFAVLFTRL